ncbi:HlyD family secretion protein [Acinetobacter sp. MD2]|uniref:HlyD family secretion protein n=1 Tax=Acinetobacter sp. MD2 TaxID=2600066 RepID=UPI002D1E73FE|nr:efflux RND transporter periplasmic adaptor subunit [Acinetobacter sp. MD2]MEB3766241.1 HlyD family secretion protein [Acinetobacter sp. MD2]
MNPQDESQDKLNSESEDKTSNKNEYTTHKPSKSGKSKIVIFIVVLLLLCLIAFGLWKSYQPALVDVQGRVEADTIHISTKVPSRIEEIYVEEGQAVQKGQALVRLYSPEVDAKKQQALASLQSALALQETVDRGAREENLDSLYANWQSLKAQAELAATTYQRGASLFQQGVISRQRRDESFAAQKSSHEMAEAAYQQYKRGKAGGTSQQRTTAAAQVDIAKAAVNEVNALMAETKLLAPISGTISKTYGKPSEIVASAVPIISLLDTAHLWVSLNVREDQYANVYKQKTISGYIPALNKTVNFKIDNIDAEGDFATLKSTRQTGGYDIRSFKLHLKPEQPVDGLRMGMSVVFKLKQAND